MRKFLVMLCIGLFLLGTVDAGAVTLVNDTYEIPAGTSTRGDDATDPEDAAWYNIGTGADTYVHAYDDAVTGSRGMMLEGGSLHAVANFSSVTLANVGDYVKLNVDMRTDRVYDFNVSASYKDYYPAFGLFDSKGTTVGNDDDAAKTLNDHGYYALMQLDSWMAIKSQLPVTTVLMGGAATDYLTYGQTAAAPLGDANQHNYELLVSKVASGLEVKFSYDGSLLMTGTDVSAAASFTFNEVAMRAYMHGDSIWDNVNITTNVPEPATMCLLSLGLVLLRRRK